MTNLTKHMMIAAAALLVAAGAAEAQAIKAEVPFSFRATGTVMPAGEYWVRGTPSLSGSRMFSLANIDTHRTVLAMPYMSNNREPKGDNPSLTFECGASQCALVQIASGLGQTYRFPRPKLGKNEDTRIAMIRAVLVKAR